LQHLTAEDKRVSCKLCCDVLSKPEDDKLSQLKLGSVTKLLSIRPGILTDITLDY